MATDPVMLSKVRLAKGLICRYTDDGVPIYDRLLPMTEVEARIERYRRPYHAAVSSASVARRLEPQEEVYGCIVAGPCG